MESPNHSEPLCPAPSKEQGIAPARILAALERCRSTDENRPSLQKPFRCGGYLYATDGAVAIRVKDNPAVVIPPLGEDLKAPTSMDSVFNKGKDLTVLSPENVAWFNRSVTAVYDKSTAEEYKVNPKDRPSCNCPFCGKRLYNRGKYSWELDLVDADEEDEKTQKMFALVVYNGDDGLALIHTKLNKLTEAFSILGFPTSISFDETRRFFFAGDGWEAVCMSNTENWVGDDGEVEVEKVAEIRVGTTSSCRP